MSHTGDILCWATFAAIVVALLACLLPAPRCCGRENPERKEDDDGQS